MEFFKSIKEHFNLRENVEELVDTVSNKYSPNVSGFLTAETFDIYQKAHDEDVKLRCLELMLKIGINSDQLNRLYSISAEHETDLK